MTSYYTAFEVNPQDDSEWGNPLEDVSGFGSDNWHMPGEGWSWSTSWRSWRVLARLVTGWS